jgi:hypothetical protein
VGQPPTATGATGAEVSLALASAGEASFVVSVASIAIHLAGPFAGCGHRDDLDGVTWASPKPVRSGGTLARWPIPA